ncbi:MAG: hypothetical protein DSY33_04260 [Archaeoglobus sp.]|nr:MAG: hypothetical protein DSY33_04260 [Archaeoglobus sp.]
MIVEGLKLTIRNIGMVAFPLAAMILLYLFIVGAVFTAMPAGEVNKIMKMTHTTNMSDYINNVKKEIISSLSKNIERTVLIFLLFGIFALIIGEFLNASLIVAARDAVLTGSFSFRKAIDEGMLYTLPVLGVDILCSFGAAAFLMPAYIIYYITGSVFIIRVYPLLFVFVAPMLVLPKYIVVVRNESVINSIAEGFRVAISNYLTAFSSVVFCALIALLSSIVPFASILGFAFSSSLLSVYMCAISINSGGVVNGGVR